MMEEQANKLTTTSRSSLDFVESVREGAIGASVFLGTSQDGEQRHLFKLSRAYKPKSSGDQGDFKYSDLYYPNNADVLARVVEEAGKRCQELDAKLKAN